MSIRKKAFLITPIGEPDTETRIHADRMYTKVFKPLSVENNFSIDYALSTTATGTVTDKIFKAILESDVVIADTVGVNRNVFYEMGMAHALNKYVIIINPIGNKPPFDTQAFDRIEYNKEEFDGPNHADAINDLKIEIVKRFISLESKNASNQGVRPFDSILKDTFDYKMNTIETWIKDLKESFTMDGKTSASIITEYIFGEKEAFDELTKAVNSATDSVKTTRFSPYIVKNTHEGFFEAIKNVMKRVNRFDRIYAANAPEKLEEIEGLIAANMGKNYNIYLTKFAFSFEIVIVDAKIVFIHFRESDKAQAKSNVLISATLKIHNQEVAREFGKIFNSITDDALIEIACKNISFANAGEKIKEIQKKFEEGLEYFQAK